MHTRAAAAWLGLALAGFAWPSVAAAQEMVLAKEIKGANEVTGASAADPLAPLAADADAGADAVELSSEAVTQMTNWVIASGDNNAVPFMVIDKVAAKVLIFDGQGQLLAATPALLGVTPGDESAPGVGDRELSAIKLKDRTTPAGRFVAKFGTAIGNRKVLWVDYSTALSLHAVVPGTRKERRLQRLKSPAPDDNRITYGCINVPAQFYAKVVRPLFKDTAGVVYILPETKPLKEVFLAYQDQEKSTPRWDGSR